MRLRLLFAFALLTGCAPRAGVLPHGPPPATLDAVNAQLADAIVSIELASGFRLRSVRNVQLSPDSIWYNVAAVGTRREARPTSDVDRIVASQKSGARTGAVLGALPGGVLFATSIWLARDAEGFGGLALVFTGGALGSVVGLLGGGIGYAVGNAQRPEGNRVLYQAPVERYLEAAPRGETPSAR